VIEEPGIKKQRPLTLDDGMPRSGRLFPSFTNLYPLRSQGAPGVAFFRKGTEVCDGEQNDGVVRG
jgi:hypothetical protein